MINLNALLKYKKIENLGYDSVYTEQPVPDIVDFNWKEIIPPPPANTSKKTLEELKVVYNASISRNKTDIEIVYNIDQNLDDIFIDLLDKYNINYPVDKINEFYTIIEPILLNIKGLWNRPRPAQLAPYYDLNIDVLVTDTHHTASYPSGHTVYSKLVALILKETYPLIKTNQLDDLVYKTAKARVLQGVHYPSDNNASIILSTFLFNKLKEKIL